MVDDLPQIEPPSGVCEGCVLGNTIESPFLRTK
jgi:hypothetical protein